MDKLKDDEWVSKIIKGLELAYAKMLEFKQKKSDLVIMNDGKVVRIPMG